MQSIIILWNKLYHFIVKAKNLKQKLCFYLTFRCSESKGEKII